MKEFILIVFLILLVRVSEAKGNSVQEMQNAIVREAQARVYHVNTYKPHKDVYKNKPQRLIELSSNFRETKSIVKLSGSDREFYRLRFINGKIFDSSGSEFDTHYLANGEAYFVVDKQGRFYATKKVKHNIFLPHSMVGGEPVLCAGTMTVKHGYLKRISDFSSEYRSRDYYALTRTVSRLKQNGVRMSRVKVIYKSDSHNKMRSFNVRR